MLRVEPESVSSAASRAGVSMWSHESSQHDSAQARLRIGSTRFGSTPFWLDSLTRGSTGPDVHDGMVGPWGATGWHGVLDAAFQN